MAGILNAEKSATPKSARLKNPALEKIETNMESKVKPDMMEMYNGIIVASMTILYDAKTRQFIKQRMSASPDMAKNAANGVADLIMMVYQNSGQDKIPERAQPYFDAAVAACVPLMCQVLDMAEQIGAVKVNPKLIDQATQLTYKETMRRFGVSEQMVRDFVAKGGSKGAPPQAAAPAAPGAV